MNLRLIAVATGTGLFALVGGAALSAKAPARPVLGCNGPVKYGDTAKTLKARFGPQARVMEVPAAEGIMEKAVVLWPSDPRRRLEVFFTDAAMTKVSTAIASGAQSRWVSHGVMMGDGLAKVQGLNGRPFNISGFEWDYGGYADWRGGKLGRWNGCQFTVRFVLPPQRGDVPSAILGDVTVSSTNPQLRKAGPVINQLAVSWPDSEI